MITLALAGLLIARAQTIPALTVLDSKVPTTPDGQYAVFFDDVPVLTARRAVGLHDHAEHTFRWVCVGRDANEARHVGRLILDKFADWRMPGGWWVLPRPDDAPTIRDDSVSADIRFSQTLVFAVHTSRSNP